MIRVGQEQLKLQCFLTGLVPSGRAALSRMWKAIYTFPSDAADLLKSLAVSLNYYKSENNRRYYHNPVDKF